ncbi:CbrC family protein [Planctomycetota bacterium]|nr:CbrC family protein [Planctomycetota bacterium]
MPHKQTFQDLGIPFPLYQGPVECCPQYKGRGTCDVCKQQADHCFNLSIGCGIRYSLDNENWIDTSDDEKLCCYKCLRQGYASITNDTELGMVSDEQIAQGATHGLPGPITESAIEQGVEAGPPNNDGWRSYKIDPKDILELTRTPNYATWQGERWRYHCGRIMPYIGEWTQKEFNEFSGDGQKAFLSIVDNSHKYAWDSLGGQVICYMHHCQVCGQLRGYWDCD